MAAPDLWVVQALRYMVVRDRAIATGKALAWQNALATYLASLDRQRSGGSRYKRIVREGTQWVERTQDGAYGTRLAMSDRVAYERRLSSGVVGYASREMRMGATRVSDGLPCAFCAMLISRGPVYKPETAAFSAHGGCGCTVALVPRGHYTPEAEAYRDLWEQGGDLNTFRQHLGEDRRADGGVTPAEREHLELGASVGNRKFERKLARLETPT